MCLDGAYNIDVSNGLNYDLQLGNLIVNDTKGVVSIMNSGSGVITEIRRDGITTKEPKGNNCNGSKEQDRNDQQDTQAQPREWWYICHVLQWKTVKRWYLQQHL